MANVQAALGNLLKSSASVGQRLNYNFQDSKYTFWPFWTIEQVGHEHRYKARAIVLDTDSGDNIVFTSYHENYRDGERAIEVVCESLTGEGPLYNIFAETIDVHTADHGVGDIVQVVETLALIWSFNAPNP